ncbi:MAG: SMC-Scp complex subunit ScpB [Planctomycetes bacterium]|nr:SMC-Scp complex subunit ScpB [Planctomycetota bacterium]
MASTTQVTDTTPDAPTAPEGKDAGKRPDIAPEELALQVEAVLMTTDRALTAPRLSEVLDGVGLKAINHAVGELNKIYESTGRSFRIEALANGWQIVTLPRFGAVLAALHRSREQTRLTPAGLETLAIIAYKQPIMRAQIEAIRGVACGEVLRTLIERHLIKITGRAEELGRPILYGTTKTFLEIFGLASLDDLPKAEEFKTGALAAPAAVKPAAPPEPAPNA